MSVNEVNAVQKIRAQYEEREVTKLDELKALHKEVRRPADVFAYLFGSIGALVLGGGMCLAMPDVIEGYMPLGIAIGAVGIIMVSVNYLIHKAHLGSRKRKYADEIVKLSSEILNENA